MKAVIRVVVQRGSASVPILEHKIDVPEKIDVPVNLTELAARIDFSIAAILRAQREAPGLSDDEYDTLVFTVDFENDDERPAT